MKPEFEIHYKYNRREVQRVDVSRLLVKYETAVTSL